MIELVAEKKMRRVIREKRNIQNRLIFEFLFVTNKLYVCGAEWRPYNILTGRVCCLQYHWKRWPVLFRAM